MSEVEIFHPEKGTKTVTRTTLGVWRRKGWTLKSPEAKNHLLPLGESKKEEDATPASDITEGEA